MIVVRINGGLGNQMFQYAFLEYIKKNNEEVYADIDAYKFHSHHNGYELKRVFNIDAPIASVEQIKKVSFYKNSIISRVMRKLLQLEISKNFEVSEKNINMIIGDDKILQDVYFDGFWQNSRYVTDVESVLREKFVFCNEIGGKNKEILKMIKDSTSVALHVRRGDYLSESGLYDICNIDYYNNAIKKLNELVKAEMNYFVFSDDIVWCKENLNILSNAHYIDWNNNDESWIDMYLMSQCKHNIIANSTFSWWGAWLNNNIEKVVIAPKMWRRDTYYDSRACENWIVV